MDEQNYAILSIAARLVSYPSNEFYEELSEIRQFIAEEIKSEAVRTSLITMVENLETMPLRVAREQYVATFDLKEKTGLYLTAHELGDSRKRGVTLTELAELIRSSGFEPLAGEIPDYMPMLYEWVVAAPEIGEMQQLIARLSFATQRIHRYLPDQNPYKPIFDVLMAAVFDELSEEKMKELEQSREKPDLDPMPYPLMYK